MSDDGVGAEGRRIITLLEGYIVTEYLYTLDKARTKGKKFTCEAKNIPKMSREFTIIDRSFSLENEKTKVKSMVVLSII